MAQVVLAHRRLGRGASRNVGATARARGGAVSAVDDGPRRGAVLVLREAVCRLHVVHLFVQRQCGRGQHVWDGGVRGAVALMASVVGVMREDLHGRGVIATDGGLQNGWAVHELLRRRLDCMHRAGALDQG